MIHLRQRLCVAILLIACHPAYAQHSEYEQPPISYYETEVHDPVALLSKRLADGKVSFEYDARFGYLSSVLKSLDVPVDSQTLVFSKTSMQFRRITPWHPRALYFNDDVYVGYCHQGEVIEVAATDPNQGAMFYTLKQKQAATPTFVRDNGSCLSCHVSGRTQKVPGYFMRSVFPAENGQPKLGNGSFTSDLTSDFKDRWGGWYVTGQHGSMRHMGNAFSDGDETDFDRNVGANRTDVSDSFDARKYLTPHSDIVALMVLQHQTQMHNAIAAANYETRRAIYQSKQMNELLERDPDFISESAKRRVQSSAENVIQHLLMKDEFELTDKVSGTTDFAQNFQAKGKRDARGRSLRDLDLETRLFKYPCSFLIHSAAFEGLPEIVRTRILKRLAAILAGDATEEYDYLTAAKRREVQQILVHTHPAYRSVLSGK